MTKHLKRILITIIFAEFLHLPALALNNEEVFSQFQFNFITPGARATALGGAFIGLADDATAAASNPAGLMILTEPEFSAEFKYLGYTTEQIYENHSYETDITKKEFDDSVLTVPFMSFVYPYKRFILSVYRQEVVNYESSFRTSAYPIALPGRITAFYPIDASVDLTVTSYGLGIVVKLFEGLSLGVSPNWSKLEIKSHTTRFKSSPFSISNPTDFSDDDGYSEVIIDDNDDGLGMNAGVLWSPHSKLSIGAMYRRGTKFTVTEKDGRWGFYFLRPYVSYYDSDLAEFTLNVPDSYGVGIAFRATDFLTLTFDVVHIRYKDLLKDFDIFVNSDTEITRDHFTVDNATEIHCGVEYILPLGKRLFALRTGVYNDPDHTIRFTGTSGDDIAEQILFPGGDDQIHFTGGLGLILNERFQIDAAANIADQNTQFSVSAVYRFGGKRPQAVEPLFSRSLSSTQDEKLSPSIRFMVVMTDGTEGKTLEIRKITTKIHTIGDIKVTVKAIGTTEFIITAALERKQKRFTADIRIDIGENEMTIKEIDSLGQVMIMKEKPDTIEFMIKFM